MDVRRIETEATLDLRARVLRPGQPLSASRYALDAQAVHFGAFAGDRIVSVVTAHPEDNALFPERDQWRIRGMATDPVNQGEGYGAGVLKSLLAWGRAEGIALFWCNARERAISFYERHGFSVESDLFEIPGIGPHKVMRVKL